MNNLKDNETKINTEKTDIEQAMEESRAGSKITYKFFATKKKIPWLIGGNDIQPQIDLPDSWFNFEQLPGNRQFDFNDQFTATIVVNSLDYTFFKVERTTTPVTGNPFVENFYFYPENTEMWLRNAYMISLAMDIYLTYTRKILKNINQPTHINRGSIVFNHLKSSDKTTYLNSLKNIESAVLNGSDSYSKLKAVRLTDYDTDNNVAYNQTPFMWGEQSNFAVRYNEWKVVDYGFPVNKVFGMNNPGLGEKWGSIEINKGNNQSVVEYAEPWVQTVSAGTYKTILTPEKSELISKEIAKYIYTESLNSIDNDTKTNEKFNKDIMNGYFAVFRSTEGYIDCYPLIGNFTMNIAAPVTLAFDNRNDSISLPATPENHMSKVANRLVLGRVYCGYNTYTKVELNNNWDSIYEDLVKNAGKNNPYSNKSFVGIFRGVIPSGKKRNVRFNVTKPGLNAVGVKQDYFTIKGIRGYFDYWVPERMFFRLNYNDFFSFGICKDNGGYGNKMFSPFSIRGNNNNNQDLITNSYVDLLQPIAIGNIEIIPARYCFLADNNLDFTVRYTGTFLDSFYLFLRSGYYNGGTYSVNLGGTLPNSTEDYANQLKIIEQQKNAGIASAVGNMIGGLIGSGSYSGNKQEISGTDKRGYSEAILEHQRAKYLGYADKVRAPQRRKFKFEEERMRHGGSFGFGGFGGIISGGIAIDNILKQSEIAKLNVGPGYLTSSASDLLNAVVFQDSINQGESVKTYQNGFFSVGYLKEFDTTTRNKYNYYFTNNGFEINSVLNPQYFTELYKTLNTVNDSTIYFEIDRDWAAINLTQLTDLYDTTIKGAVLEQLATGIRMKKFN